MASVPKEKIAHEESRSVSDGTGSPRGVPAVVSRYETPLLRYVGQMLDADNAQDVVQETFLRLHRYVLRKGRSGIRHLPSWLFRVAHNLALDVGRKRKLENRLRERPTQVVVQEESGVEGLDDLMHRAACERVLEEFQELPDNLRQVLFLKVMQGMKLREISGVTGLTVGNVAYRINRGLKELARRLKEAKVI